MPYLPATFRHSPRIDLSKPPVPEISASFVSLRARMSAKIFSHAMRSVCGVLNTHFFAGSTMTDRTGERDERRLRLLGERDRRHGGTGGRAADDDVDLVLLDQPLGERARLLGVAAVVVDDELQLAAGNAAARVDALDVHLERLLLGVAQKRRGSGHGKKRADPDRLLRKRGCGGERQSDTRDAHHRPAFLMQSMATSSL